MSPVDLICMRCIHFQHGLGGCKAFKEIPVERIVMKGHDHVYKDQIGKYVFEEEKPAPMTS